MSSYRLTTLGTNTELLDAAVRPAARANGTTARIVHVPRGISRHVVRFVEAGGEVFAVKEATDRFVLREHRCCARSPSTPCRSSTRTARSIERTRPTTARSCGGLLITRHLPFSQPYRSLFTGRGLPQLRIRLLDALAELFVRLHLAGFYWGDCSLSNTLFRRDAGALAAYLVDAETGELHPTAVRRPARARPRHRRPRTSPASCSTCRPPAASTRTIDVGRDRARSLQPALRVAVGRAHPRRDRAAGTRTTGSTSGSGG